MRGTGGWCVYPLLCPAESSPTAAFFKRRERKRRDAEGCVVEPLVYSVSRTMQLTERQLTRHYAQLAQKLREYFPAADGRVIVEYVEALRACDLLATPPALDRLITAQHLISSTVPVIELEP